MRNAVFFFELAHKSRSGIGRAKRATASVSRRLQGAAGVETVEQARKEWKEVAYCAEQTLEDGVCKVEGQKDDVEREGHGLGDLALWRRHHSRCRLETSSCASY